MPEGAPTSALGARSGAPSGLRPSSFVMCNTPVEVQFITSAGCLNYPCRTPAIAIGDAQTTLDQVQLEQANIIRRGCRRRALQIRREPLAALDVASLRCRSELARGHVLDHALT